MKKRILFLFVGVVLVVFFVDGVSATNYYVREGATGSEDGSDWTNAWTELPEILGRGDTYYIADGNYGAYTYDDAASGSSYIYIKKATASDHGTDTGWNPSYGNGQAYFTGTQTFESSYWQFDGNTDVVGNYGFNITSHVTNWMNGILIDPDGIDLSHFLIKDVGIAMQESTDGSRCIKGAGSRSSADYLDYVTIHNCYFENFGDGITIDSGGAAHGHYVYEYCYFHRDTSPEYNNGDHGDAIVITESTDITIRYNIFNWNGQNIWHGGYADSSPSDNTNEYVYGNLFYCDDETIGASTTGWLKKNTVYPTGVYIYDNTFYGLYYPIKDSDDTITDGYIKNNIFVNNYRLSDWGQFSHDWNAADEDLGEDHDQQVTSAIFTNAGSYDFTLSAATDAGDDTIGAMYNTDMLGNIRGADGVWDRGAYEYTEPAPAYYVDNAATGSNDGTSWANAWQGFSSINWALIQPGDTIYISGGPGGRTYAETLNIGADGTSVNPINIKTGAAHPTLSSGHGGLVTITGTPGDNHGIVFNNHDYVTIDGNNGKSGSYTYANIKVYNTGDTGIYGPGCTGIRILYVWVDHCGNEGGEDGIRVTECDGGTEVGWCRVEYPYQDGIEIGKQFPTDYGLQSLHDSLVQNVPDDILAGDGGVDIYKNILGPWVSEPYGAPGHLDGFQAYDGYLRIYNNTFRTGDNAVEGTNAALYLTNAFDRNTCNHIKVYNNIFYGYGESYEEAKYNGVDIDDSGDSAPGMDDIVVVDNTFADWGGVAINIESDNSDPMTNVVIKNNLIHNCKTSGSDTPLVAAGSIDYGSSSLDIDRNIVSAGVKGGGMIGWNGGYYTVAEFNAFTNEPGLIDPPGGRDNRNDEPSFVSYTPAGGGSNDLHLSESDTAARDQGLDLSSLTDMPTWPDDKDGIPRPQGPAWDIGAYEFIGPLSTCSGLGGVDCCISPETCPGTDLGPASDCVGGVCCDQACELPPLTCQDLGYRCCDSCLSGPHIEYDDDCFPQVCCEVCTEQHFLPGQFIEAEDGDLTSPMQTGSDASASGGYYVYTGTGQQGSVGFTFDIQQAGKYSMQARVLTYGTPMDAHDSFYVGLDGEPAQGNESLTYDILLTGVFAWDNVSLRGPGGTFDDPEFDPIVWDLSQGLHTFTFHGREDNAWLDQIILRRLHHRADTDQDGCIVMGEIIAFIDKWKISSQDVPMWEMMEAIGLWKSGAGCN